MRTLTKTQKDLNSANATIRALQITLDQRDARIRSEESDNNTLRINVRTRDESIARFESEVAKLKETIINREAYIGRLCINQGVIR